MMMSQDVERLAKGSPPNGALWIACRPPRRSGGTKRRIERGTLRLALRVNRPGARKKSRQGRRHYGINRDLASGLRGVQSFGRKATGQKVGLGSRNSTP